MYSSITKDIRISLEHKYLASESNVLKNRFIHSYSIRVDNLGNETIQLLERHWLILDSTCNMREVRGDGVVGQQPILGPGDIFDYSSWCPLTSEYGIMYGHFLMQYQESGETFKAIVPEMKFIAPCKLN